MSFTSATTGYVVGAGGTILKTTDGGSTWAAQTSGTTNTLNGVSFPTATAGYAVGSAGTILLSTMTSPLPVATTGFTARAAGSANALSWTAGGSTGSGFAIERSATGSGFAAIGTVHGSGSAYSFTDEAPVATSYYRLRLMAENGAETYSPVALVRRGAAGGGTVTVAPQQAAGSLVLTNTDASLDGGTAHVLNLQGREVVRFTLAPSVTLDLSGWAPGLYALRLPSGDVLRVVKQ